MLNMTNPYLQNTAAKKSFLRKGTIVLSVLAIIFAVFLTRFAISGSRKSLLTNVPDSDDAYSMAKRFVRPTIKFQKVIFPETGYQCAQEPDSVFVLKSYAEAKGDPRPDDITTFQITLKFLGGKASDENSWQVLSLIEN